MISKADVKSVIDEAEDSFRECWNTLSLLGSKDSRDGQKEADLSKGLLDFQSALARTLYDLSEMYRKLHQEKRGIIARKAELTPEWFRHRLALLSEYQGFIKATISLGKRLGDAFACSSTCQRRTICSNMATTRDSSYSRRG